MPYSELSCIHRAADGVCLCFLCKILVSPIACKAINSAIESKRLNSAQWAKMNHHKIVDRIKHINIVTILYMFIAHIGAVVCLCLSQTQMKSINNSIVSMTIAPCVNMYDDEQKKRQWLFRNLFCIDRLSYILPLCVRLYNLITFGCAYEWHVSVSLFGILVLCRQKVKQLNVHREFLA